MKLLLIFCFYIVAVACNNYAFILDCGSSGVKIATYGVLDCPTLFASSTPMLCPDGKKTDDLVTISKSTTLKANFVNFFKSYVTEIQRIDTTNTVEVIAFATAGNRIVDVTLDVESWNVGKALLDENLAGVTVDQSKSWALLHGTQEAMVEFIAVNFPTATAGSSTTALDKTIEDSTFSEWKNVVSLGGASAQLAIPLNSEDKIGAAFHWSQTRWLDIEYFQAGTKCNSEKLPSFSISIGYYHKYGKFKFSTVTRTEMTKCAPNGDTKNAKACVLFISFLSGFVGTTTSPCSIPKDASASDIDALITTAKDEEGTGACVHNLVGGIDQTEAIMSKWKLNDATIISPANAGSISDCTATATIGGIGKDTVLASSADWDTFVQSDCQARVVNRLLNYDFSFVNSGGNTVTSSSPFLNMVWTASGTMRPAAMKSKTGAILDPPKFRCHKQFTTSYLKFLGIKQSTLVKFEGNNGEGGDWTEGIARILGFNRKCGTTLPKSQCADCKSKLDLPSSTFTLEQTDLFALESAIDNLI